MTTEKTIICSAIIFCLVTFLIGFLLGGKMARDAFWSSLERCPRLFVSEYLDYFKYGRKPE